MGLLQVLLVCAEIVSTIDAAGNPKPTRTTMTKTTTATITTTTTSRNFLSFYDSLNRHDLDTVVDMFAPDGVYYHTGIATARGRDQLLLFFSAMFEAGEYEARPIMVDAQYALPESESHETRAAKAFIYTRESYCGSVRDSIFIEEGQIKAMMTTKANHADPPAAGFVYPTILSSQLIKAKGSKKDEDVVKDVVDTYFNAYSNNLPRSMATPFSRQPDSSFFMFDFHPQWSASNGWQYKTPHGCSTSKDCETAPYIVNSSRALLDLLQNFSQGYVNIDRKYDEVRVWGQLALVTIASNGCEGNDLTPEGTPPMPSRVMIVLHKASGTKFKKWKIHSFMFTDDPASQLTGPVAKCKGEPDCIEGAKVGTCFFGGMVGCSSSKGNASCVGSACTCAEGYCSQDGSTCMLTPTTTTTRTSTTTTTTLFCDENIDVGHCLVFGCFAGHGNVHCENERCRCDRGSCSEDGYTCIPNPWQSSPPASPAEYVEELQSLPTHDTQAQHVSVDEVYEGVDGSVGLTIAGVVFSIGCFKLISSSRARGRPMIAEPLLQ